MRSATRVAVSTFGAFAGLLAILASLLFLVWAIWLIEWRNGSLGLMLLALVMLLVGEALVRRFLVLCLALLEPRTRWHHCAYQGLTPVALNESTGIDMATLMQLEENAEVDPTIAILTCYADAVGKKVYLALANAE
jgi:hypothetical protein